MDEFINQHQSQKEPLHGKTTTKTYTNSKKFFLVQFSRHPQNLIHAVLTEKEVTTPMDNGTSISDIFINDGQQITPGNLLFTYENEDFVNIEFQKLKLWSFQKGFDEHDNSTTIGPNTWILVLYTCHRANIVYTIINNRETFHGIRNPYSDVVCYLNFGDNVYQAIIVRKSENFGELLEVLSGIKNCCLGLVFPLKHHSHTAEASAIPPPEFQSFCGTVEEFLQRSDCHNHSHLDASLVRLEKKMQDDAVMLLEWVNALEHMKQNAEEYKN